MEPEFVHEDTRRKLTQLFTAEIKQVNVYDCKANVELGNHFHKDTVEYFYIIEGELESNGKYLQEGELFVYHPQQIHRIVTRTACRFMTFLTKPFNEKEPDIWKS